MRIYELEILKWECCIGIYLGSPSWEAFDYFSHSLLWQRLACQETSGGMQDLTQKSSSAFCFFLFLGLAGLFSFGAGAGFGAAAAIAAIFFASAAYSSAALSVAFLAAASLSWASYS